MTIPKVSVIIPNYNHEKYLDARIQSVLNQDLYDFEIILLDDASTDKSIDVIQRYRGKKQFKIEINSTNSGSTFAQWRRGISFSEAEYIWIAESDDLADPKFLSTLVSILDNNPNVVLSYCQSNYINEAGHIVGTAKTWTDDLDIKKWSFDYISDGITECKSFLSVKNTIPNASAVVFRRAYFNSIDTKSDLRLCGDWLIWSRLISLGDLAFCKETLNYFRIHTNNVRSSTSKEMTADEFLKVSREVIAANKLDQHEKKIISDKLLSFWKHFLLNYKYASSFKYVYYLATLNRFNALRLVFSLISSRILRRIRRSKSLSL